MLYITRFEIKNLMSKVEWKLFHFLDTDIDQSARFFSLETPRIKSTPRWLLMRCVTTSPHVVAILKIDILSLINSFPYSLPLSSNPFLSYFIVSVRRIFMNMQEKIIREKMKIIITQTLASLVSLHFFLRRWVVTEIVSRDDIHTQQLWKLLPNDVLSVSKKDS